MQRAATRLRRAIELNDEHGVLRALNDIPVLDTDEVCADGRPLAIALVHQNYAVATMLIKRGASPDYRDNFNEWYILDVPAILSERSSVRFLFYHGARIPRHFEFYSKSSRHIHEYIYRDWSPVNHREWPLALKAQLRELLLVTRPIAMSRVLLYYLFRWLASSHFVFFV
jgi:hypothetical protein